MGTRARALERLSFWRAPLRRASAGLAQVSSNASVVSAPRPPLLAHHLVADRRAVGFRALPRVPLTLALLTLAALFRLILLARGWPALDSDEAVTGLMARHIAFAHEYPVFFWGEHYMGNLQAYVAAAFFTIFGASTFALHMTVLLFTLGFLAAMFALGRAAYGQVVGLLTLGWLALGPPFAVLREAMAACGYQDVLLFGALLLLGVYSRLRQPGSKPTDRRAWLGCLATYAAIGLCVGVGMWSDLLMAPVALVSLVVLVVLRRREVFHLGGVALLAGVLLGNAPALSYNLANHFEQYTEAVKLSQGGTEHTPPLSPVAGIGETLTVALPTILGSPHVCVNRGQIPVSYPAPLAEERAGATGPCETGNLLLSLSALTVYALVAWQLALVAASWLLGRWRRAQGALHVAQAPDIPAAETRARYWLRGMLVAIAAIHLALYYRSPDVVRFQLTSARYLLPLYLTIPLIFGALWSYALPTLQRLAAAYANLLAEYCQGGLAGALRQGVGVRTPNHTSWRHVGASGRLRWARGPVAAVTLLALLGLSLYGGVVTQARAADTALFAQPTAPTDAAIIAFLDAHNIHTFYSDYWLCYQLAFETNERITCAVRGLRGETGLQLATNRYDPYVARLNMERFPAYLFTAGSDQDTKFFSEATKLALPHTGYMRAQVGATAVYYYPGAYPPPRDTTIGTPVARTVRMMGYTAS